MSDPKIREGANVLQPVNYGLDTNDPYHQADQVEPNATWGQNTYMDVEYLSSNESTTVSW